MADQDTTKSLDNIKEMEKDIATELSQKVKLVQGQNLQQSGTVDLNPVIATPIASNPGIEKKVEDFSLEDVNNLLNEVDETFDSTLKEIKSDLENVQFTQPLESITIGDYLKGDDAKGDDSPSAEPAPVAEATAKNTIKKKPQFWGSLGALGLNLALLPIDIVVTTGKQIYSLKNTPPKEVAKGLVTALRHPVILRTQHFKIFFNTVLSYKKIRYIQVLVLFLMSVGLFYMVQDMARHTTRKIEVDPFLKSFDEVATSNKEMESEVKGEEAGAPAPEFVVAFPRLVANLKTTSIRKQPMVAMELFIAMSNSESAVEIKSRETEIRDIMARTLEEMTFQEVDSPEGKEKLKLRLRLAINHILNNGRVVRLFFKSIQASD